MGLANQKIFAGLLIFCLILPGVSPLFLGQSRECPRCEGSGREPGTLFEDCSKCDGDGEVGYFIDDAGLEDMLSFLLLIVIILAVVGSIVASTSGGEKKEIHYVESTKSQQPSRQQSKIGNDYSEGMSQKGSLQERKKKKKFYCPNCGRNILHDVQQCPYCGGEIED